MSTTHPETPKLNAVKAILRTRGYKDLNKDQENQLQTLSQLDEMRAVEIADEIVNSPAERTARAVNSIRSKSSRIFGLISKALEPEDTK